MQYFHFIWSGKYYFVIITLQHCVSPCLALTAEGNRDRFIMSINWVNWLILISCFLNLTRDSASLGKHTILQQDQKQRKPDNKSFWFQGMFTRQTFNILAEVKQIPMTLQSMVCSELCLCWRHPRRVHIPKKRKKKTINLFEYEAHVMNL